MLSSNIAVVISPDDTTAASISSGHKRRQMDGRLRMYRTSKSFWLRRRFKQIYIRTSVHDRRFFIILAIPQLSFAWPVFIIFFFFHGVTSRRLKTTRLDYNNPNEYCVYDPRRVCLIENLANVSPTISRTFEGNVFDGALRFILPQLNTPVGTVSFDRTIKYRNVREIASFARQAMRTNPDLPDSEPYILYFQF